MTARQGGAIDRDTARLSCASPWRPLSTTLKKLQASTIPSRCNQPFLALCQALCHRRRPAEAGESWQSSQDAERNELECAGPVSAPYACAIRQSGKRPTFLRSAARHGADAGQLFLHGVFFDARTVRASAAAAHASGQPGSPSLPSRLATPDQFEAPGCRRSPPPAGAQDSHPRPRRPSRSPLAATSTTAPAPANGAGGNRASQTPLPFAQSCGSLGACCN
jgi:hypothetical protein